MKYERNEYPRPQFRRNEWTNLNGEWEFEFDDNNDGVKRGLYNGKATLKKQNKCTVLLSISCKRYR